MIGVIFHPLSSKTAISVLDSRLLARGPDQMACPQRGVSALRADRGATANQNGRLPFREGGVR